MTERLPTRGEARDTGPGLPYGRANLVALGWHLPVLAALYGYSFLAYGKDSCEASTTALSCFSDAEWALLLLVVALSLLVVSWLVSMAIAAWLLHRGLSTSRAGAVAAFSSMVLLWTGFRLTLAVMIG